MSKLTPPAPQNMKRRTRFMLEHPKHPKAKAWLDFMALKLGHRAAAAWFAKEKSDNRPWEQFIKDFISEFTRKEKPNARSA